MSGWTIPRSNSTSWVESMSEGGVYIDNLILINNNDKGLLTPDYIPVTEIVAQR